MKAGSNNGMKGCALPACEGRATSAKDRHEHCGRDSMHSRACGMAHLGGELETNRDREDSCWTKIIIIKAWSSCGLISCSRDNKHSSRVEFLQCMGSAITQAWA